MDTINANVYLQGRGRRAMSWMLFRHQPWGEEEGLRVQFTILYEVRLREGLRFISEALEQDQIQWLRKIGSRWELNIVELRRFLDAADPCGDYTKWFRPLIDWVPDVVQVDPELEHRKPSALSKYASPRVETLIQFNVFKQECLMNLKKRIFLSHKGANKPKVERFYATLRLLGFDPWLDTEDMPAGSELHRGIREGFRDSCACVFFITPEFKDERYLRGEINYALEEKTDKGGRFAIVTLVFKGEDGAEGVVPDLLKSYVWKHPPTDLDALQEIVRALPIEVGPTTWRPGL